MEKRISKICVIVVFVVLIIGTPIIYYTIKAINGENSDIVKIIDFDLKENRDKEKLEYNDIFDFPQNFEKFFDDNIPFRSFLVQSKRGIETNVEAPYINYIQDFLMNIGKKKIKKEKQYIVSDEKFMDYAVKQFTNHALMPWEEEEVDDSEYPMKVMGEAILGRKKWLFYNNQDNIDYYKGTNILKEKEYAEYVKKLEKLDNLCKERGKNVIFLIIPNKNQVYGEYMPTIEKDNEEGRLDRIKNYIATNSNVKFLYPKDILKEKKKNYRVYYKYDTHYNAAGSYIVYSEVMKALGRDIPDIDDIKLGRTESLGRDLVILSGQTMDNYGDDFNYDIHYKDDIKSTVLYYDNDNTENANSHAEMHENKLLDSGGALLVGDSFRLNMQDFLVKDFRVANIIGFNNSKRSKYIKDALESTDTIIIEVVERNEYAHLPVWVKLITDAMAKVPIPKVE